MDGEGQQLQWFQFGLKGKITLGVSLLVFLSLLSMGGGIIWQSYQMAISSALNIASGHIERRSSDVQQVVTRLGTDIKYLQNASAIQAMIHADHNNGIDPASGKSAGLLSTEIGNLFQIMVDTHDGYYQLRLIDNTGMERVRVERVGTQAQLIVEERLQNRADSNYFTSTMKLKPNEIFYSNVNMERKRGQLEIPYKPVFRVATPVYLDGKPRGIVIINMDSRKLFASTKLPYQEGVAEYVVNQDGYFLNHPDDSKEFGFDMGFVYRLQELEPHQIHNLDKMDFFTGHEVDESHAHAYKKIYFDVRDRSRYWALFHTISDDLIFRDTGLVVKTMFAIGLSIIFLSILVTVWFVSRGVVEPVLLLYEGAKKMNEGDLSIRLPENNVKGEFLALYKTLNTFAATQENSVAKFKEDLESRTEELSSVISCLGEGLISITTDGIIKAFNPAAEEIFGYRSVEAIGNSISILMSDEHRRRYDLNYFLRSGHNSQFGKNIEAIGRRKDGSTFPFEMVINPADIGGKRIFIGLIRDISEKKDIDTQMANKNRQLEMLGRYEKSNAETMRLFTGTHQVEIALEGVLDLLADNHGVCSSAIYTLKSNGKFTCSAMHGIPSTLEEEIVVGKGLLGQAIKNKQPIIIKTSDEDYELIIDVGIVSFKPETIIVNPIVYQEKVIGVMVALAGKMRREDDLLFINRLCDQLGIGINNLNQYNDLQKLTERLAQRSDEISQKNAELEQASTMKSEFLANMSHELRTPLNAIIGFSEMLKNDMAGPLSDEQKTFVNDIFDSGEHLLGLINDILDLSKIEAGRHEMYVEQISIPELLEVAMGIIREKAQANSISLDLQIEETVGEIFADGRKVKQIIYNLLSNAVKFTLEGGSVSLSAKRIAGKKQNGIDPVQKDDYIAIAVSDTGIGISEEDLKLLFKPFVQIDSSLSRKFEGTGLGLMMVKSLAEMHGGSVSIDSRVGEGSVFTVLLPVEQKTGSESTDKMT